MAWFLGKKKQEPVQTTQATQTQNSKPEAVQKQCFPERDKKTLKRMLDDAQMISMRLNRPKPPRLDNEELLTAALGFYLNKSAGIPVSHVL